MDIERGLGRLQEMAERLAWQVDQSGVTGVGTDESGTVRLILDDVGRVQQVDIGHLWWREPGPDRLSEAILDAANRAVTDRMKAWSERVAEREGREPAADRPASPTCRERANDESVHLHTALPVTRDIWVEDLLRVSEVAKAAISESGDFRDRVAAQARQQVTGRSRGDRVTVAMTGGQITGVEINQRWLQEQPSGQALGSEVRAACRDAYDRVAREEAAILAGSPALTELREIIADPAALLRRLGLNG